MFSAAPKEPPMQRTIGCFFALLFVAAAQAPAQSPDDLLEKAVKEKQHGAAADPGGSSKLLSDADKLAEQRKFDEAIDLYEKAYRKNPSDQSSYYKLLIAKRA